jgi:hypothetical protein
VREHVGLLEASAVANENEMAILAEELEIWRSMRHPSAL